MWADVKAEGIIYLEEGLYTFTLDSEVNFTVYASPYTPAFNNWASGYDSKQDRFNCEAKNPISAGADIVITHGPAFGFLDYDNG